MNKPAPFPTNEPTTIATRLGLPLPTAPVPFKWDYSGLDDDARITIRNYVMQIRDWSRKTVQYAISIGYALSAVKLRLKHGEFEKWYKAEFNMDRHTAENLMNLAKRAPEIKSEDVFAFGLSIAYQLTAPSVTPEVQAEVVDELEILDAQGVKVTNQLVRVIIMDKKGKAALKKVPPAMQEPVLQLMARNAPDHQVTSSDVEHAVETVQEEALTSGYNSVSGDSAPSEQPTYRDASYNERRHEDKPRRQSVLSCKATVTHIDGLTMTVKLDADPVNLGEGEIIWLVGYSTASEPESI